MNPNPHKPPQSQPTMGRRATPHKLPNQPVPTKTCDSPNTTLALRRTARKAAHTKPGFYNETSLARRASGGKDGGVGGGVEKGRVVKSKKEKKVVKKMAQLRVSKMRRVKMCRAPMWALRRKGLVA